MSKKKILIIVVASLTLIALLITAVPVLAASSSPLTNPAQITPANKAGALIRLLLVQDETKVDAYIATAVSNGKLTADQAVKVKDFWTAHHKQFAWNFTLRRLLRAQNESNVKTFLDKVVTNGKMTPEQETKILQIWEVLHNTAPTTTTTQ
jgi:polyhydroxyalkanoate synthesis regulator phasin